MEGNAAVLVDVFIGTFPVFWYVYSVFFANWYLCFMPSLLGSLVSFFNACLTKTKNLTAAYVN